MFRKGRALLADVHPGRDIVIDHDSAFISSMRAGYAIVEHAILGGDTGAPAGAFDPLGDALRDTNRLLEEVVTELRSLNPSSTAD
jgi:hypothetical protein